MSRWRVGGAVTQRSAKPRRRVQLPYVPPYDLPAGSVHSNHVVYARMMESVDMRDLKSLGLRAVRVQVPLCAPKCY